MSESRFGMNQSPAGKRHAPTKTSGAAGQTSQRRKGTGTNVTSVNTPNNIKITLQEVKK
jgi:hypothetical protein